MAVSRDFPRSRKARRRIADRERQEAEHTERQLLRLARMIPAEAQRWVREHRKDAP